MTTVKQLTLIAACSLVFSVTGLAADPVILTSLGENGDLSISTTHTNAVYRIEWNSQISADIFTPWTPLFSTFVTNTTTTVKVPMFFRVVTVSSTIQIVGIWDWFNKDVHQFLPDGTSETLFSKKLGAAIPEIFGTWKEVWPGLYVLTWATNFVDSLYISPAGSVLHGYNQNGTHVSGTKRTQ